MNRRMSLSRNEVRFAIVSPFYMFLSIFFVLASRPWYRKKRFMIPISLLMATFIAAAIVGSVVATRPKTGTPRMFFILFLF